MHTANAEGVGALDVPVAQAIRLKGRLADAGINAALRFSDHRVFTGGVAVVADAKGRLDIVAAAALTQTARRGLASSVRMSGTAAELDNVDDWLGLLPPKTELVTEARLRSTTELSSAQRSMAWLPSSLKPRIWWRRGAALPAMASGVRSRCPLLAAESPTSLLPVSGIAAPAESAWLSLAVDLVSFAGSNGRVCKDALFRALDTCVADGDELLDVLSWVCPRQAADARRNRRLAILLIGLGDLVSMAGDDPASLACLYRLDKLLGAVHEHLWRRSRELARAKGSLPALTEHQPSANWRDERHRDAWVSRWHDAVQRSMVRHRNLLVLSPYSLLPRSGRGSGAFADLLPLMAHADALTFSGPVGFGTWSAADVKAFLDRMCAEVRRFNAATLIATGA